MAEAKQEQYAEIKCEKRDGVATVTITRAQAYNAYSTTTLRELRDAFRDAAWDDGVAVVVLTGSGDRAYCTGGDVKEYADIYTKRPRQYWKYMGLFAECHDALRDLGKPTIARINGIVAGGGNEFNMACDLAVAAEHATIRQVGTRVGSVACGGATQWLPILIGDRRAREMLFTCEPISAHQALQWGLVNQVIPSVKAPDGQYLSLKTVPEIDAAVKDPKNVIDLSALDQAVNVLCEKLIDKFPECTRYTKTQVNFWKDLSWHMTIGHAQDWLALHFACLEPYEGMTAFVEKRAPRYKEIRKKMAAGEATEFLWGPWTRTCTKCGAKGLPQEFSYCGKCGAQLQR